MQIWPHIYRFPETPTCWCVQMHISESSHASLRLTKPRASVAVSLHLFLCPDTPREVACSWCPWLRGEGEEGREEAWGKTDSPAAKVSNVILFPSIR